ncbi:MAG: hypothetical protein M5U14_13420 [Acidimicrobiia bacterium]|nr:hypothetical protein [Acidimicrobiia bacterium]
MRRQPHGGTTHPVLARPGNGYGRPVGRPGPHGHVAPAPFPEPAWFAMDAPPLEPWRVGVLDVRSAERRLLDDRP